MGNAIRNCLEQRAGSHQRLYFLDGTFPRDLPGHFQSYEDVPGESTCHWAVSHQAHNVLTSVTGCSSSRQVVEGFNIFRAAALMPSSTKPFCHVSAVKARVASLAAAVAAWSHMIWFHSMWWTIHGHTEPFCSWSACTLIEHQLCTCSHCLSTSLSLSDHCHFVQMSGAACTEKAGPTALKAQSHESQQQSLAYHTSCQTTHYGVTV